MAKKQVHWLQNPNKNFIGHWDLPDEKDLEVTISSAQWESVEHPKTKIKNSFRVVRFKENIKPLICNEINATSIMISTGCKQMGESVGKKIKLYVGKFLPDDSKVPIDCVRIRRPEKATKEQTLKSLIELYEDVKEKVKEEDKTNIERIIDKKEFLSYRKVIKHLIKLQQHG